MPFHIVQLKIEDYWHGRDMEVMAVSCRKLFTLYVKWTELRILLRWDLWKTNNGRSFCFIVLKLKLLNGQLYTLCTQLEPQYLRCMRIEYGVAKFEFCGTVNLHLSITVALKKHERKCHLTINAASILYSKYSWTQSFALDSL